MEEALTSNLQENNSPRQGLEVQYPGNHPETKRNNKRSKRKKKSYSFI